MGQKGSVIEAQKMQLSKLNQNTSKGITLNFHIPQEMNFFDN